MVKFFFSLIYGPQDKVNVNQGCHSQGKVREKQKFFKIREKSGSFLQSQGKSLILSKSVKSQRILFSGFIVHKFSSIL